MVWSAFLKCISNLLLCLFIQDDNIDYHSLPTFCKMTPHWYYLRYTISKRGTWKRSWGIITSKIHLEPPWELWGTQLNRISSSLPLLHHYHVSLFRLHPFPWILNTKLQTPIPPPMFPHDVISVELGSNALQHYPRQLYIHLNFPQILFNVNVSPFFFNLSLKYSF